VIENTPNKSSQRAHNFRSPAVVNGGTKVKPIERRSRSAYCFAIERRSRLQGFCATAVANDRTEASVGYDWTEEPVGNQGIAIGRTSRSAIKGRGLDGSRAFSAATDRTDASVGSLFCYDKVEREKLGGYRARLTATDRGGSTAVDRF
jgi:hypothetical protein